MEVSVYQALNTMSSISSIMKQAYSINSFGEGEVILSNGKIHHFAEMMVKVLRVSTEAELAGYSKDTDVFNGPKDKDGFWHFLVLQPFDWGILPRVLARLSSEESDDMIRKMHRVYVDEFYS